MAQSVKFYRYYERWMKLYKKGAVQPVTYQKYQITQQQLTKLAPELRMKELSRLTYQQLLNDYASNHERQTVMDFHHHLKSALLDAIDDGLLKRDPTRKAVIKGIIQRKHKVKFLNQKETQALLNGLDLGTEINWDYFILLIAKTGLRFAEALGLTPDDFDFAHHRLDINKTWNYKERQGGFALTKNSSSVRKVELDWQTVMLKVV
ncbi:hypothetical protein AYR56_07480 [Loigolactobacillus backii]|uniref:Tyr recombinase domain-containing protein n=1 Tax=Loigolactobacillus backii TaxID=375175 RepID=A0A192H2E1_9LACO|nr:hypothetical protein AYR53_09525 [Loigolactobacillus backii]ANK70013.1 hypothetical protein AYR56_07480 [Loigolactobacillus backii]